MIQNLQNIISNNYIDFRSDIDINKIKYIYCIPRHGLCNRLRTINGCYLLSKILNSKLTVLWLSEISWNGKNHIEPNYSEIFNLKNSVIDVKFDNFLKKYKDDNINLINNINDLLNPQWKPNKKQCIVYQYQNTIWICSNTSIFTDDIIKNNNNQIINIQKYNYQWLSIKTDILNYCNQFININLGQNYIGIHIRRTDNTISIKHSSIQVFDLIISNIIHNNKVIKIYLASDDNKEKIFFFKKYSNNIIIRKTQNRYDNNSSIDAIIDLLLLSKASHIYGSYGSSFSVEASNINNTKLTLVTNNINI